MSRRARRLMLAGCILAAAIVAVLVLVTRDERVEAPPDPIRPAKVVRRQPASVQPDVVPPPTTSATFVLEGQVIDEDDRPIEGAVVMLDTWPEERTATSEGDGSFSFAAVPEGEYLAVASKGALTSPTSRVHVRARPDLVTLRLTRGCDVRVHVLAAEDRSPIAGATVTGGFGHTGTTGADGTSELHGMVSHVGLRARAPGRASVQRQVQLASGDIEDVTIVLPRGASMSGTVVGPDDALVANATVYVTTIGRFGDFPREATTDATGAWSVDGLAAGSYQLEAASRFFTSAAPFVVELDGIHDRTGVVVHVETGAQLAGKVLDARGAPVAGALVEISAESIRFGRSTRSDPAGAFALLGVPPGTYLVSASSALSSSTRQRVEAPDHQRVEIELRVADSSIAGTVVDTDGEPLADVEVSVFTRQALYGGTSRRDTTDPAGHFDFGGMPPGSYSLFATRRGQIETYDEGIEVHAGDRDVRIVLPGITTITGRVLLDKKPVTYFGLVVAQPDAYHWRYGFPISFRVADGRFTQSGVPAGDRKIVILGPGFTRHFLDVHLTDGKKLDLGDINVERGQQISGHVTDARGSPVAGATVRVEQRPYPFELPPMRRAVEGIELATTDESGAYTLAGIAPPDLRYHPPLRNYVSAKHPTWGSVPRRRLDPTESTVDLVLAATGGIDGVVEGAPSTHDHVVAQREHATDFMLAPIQNRHFKFDNLPAGNYTLTIARQNADGFAVPPLSVTVVADKRIPAVFKLPPSVTLAVHVADGSCQTVMLLPPGTSPPPTDPRLAAGLADCDGADAIVEGVVPGSYRACLPPDRCARPLEPGPPDVRVSSEVTRTCGIHRAGRNQAARAPCAIALSRVPVTSQLADVAQW